MTWTFASAPRANPSKKSVSNSVCKSPTSARRPGVDDEGRAPAQVDGGDGERLVHRHDEVARAQNAALVAQREVEGLAQRDAHVFHGVVLIDIEVALAGEREVEAAVAREQLQHVVEEADACGDVYVPCPSMVSVKAIFVSVVSRLIVPVLFSSLI